jgi:protein gp37
MPTKIEWVKSEDGTRGETWNPVTGCSKVSQGCKNCYAERDWARMQHVPVYKGRAFTDVACHPERLDQPLRWTRPRTIFVNSMSDLFHDDIPVEFIDKVFAVMGNVFCKMETPHTFQVLTKRPERMEQYLNDPDVLRRITIAMKAMGLDLPGENSPPAWPLPNVWLGVSVEDQAAADERIPLLLKTPAAVRWVSAEPLLGPVDLETIRNTTDLGEGQPWLHPLTGAVSDGHGDVCTVPGLDWIVVGGESGPNSRPMHPNWVKSLRDQCAQANVAFLFKQWGEWAPRSECYHTLTNGAAAADMDPGATRWPVIRLTEGGTNGRNLANAGLGDDCYMQKVGRKLAGRAFYGTVHDEYPNRMAGA